MENLLLGITRSKSEYIVRSNINFYVFLCIRICFSNERIYENVDRVTVGYMNEGP